MNLYANEPVYRSLGVDQSVDRLKEVEMNGMIKSTMIKGETKTSTTGMMMNNNVDKTSMKISNININEPSVPFDMYPLSKTSIMIKDKERIEEIMIKTCECMNGVMDNKNGKIDCSLSSNTKISIIIIRNRENDEYYLEFNRVDGCPFIFHYYYYKTINDILSIMNDISHINTDEIKMKLKQSETKMKMWHTTALSESCLSMPKPLSLSRSSNNQQLLSSA